MPDLKLSNAAITLALCCCGSSHHHLTPIVSGLLLPTAGYSDWRADLFFFASCSTPSVPHAALPACCSVYLNSVVLAAVNSVLAIGGVGGLAVGLAGREILENLFTGLIILSSSPFEVGDEVLFTPPTGSVRPLHPHQLQKALHIHKLQLIMTHTCECCMMSCTLTVPISDSSDTSAGQACLSGCKGMIVAELQAASLPQFCLGQQPCICAATYRVESNFVKAMQSSPNPSTY